MAKNFLQDVVPPENRSIRHIPLPDRKSSKKTTRTSSTQRPPVDSRENVIENSKDMPETIPQKSSKSRKKGSSKLFIWGGIFFAVICVIFILSFVFGGAVVTVTAKKQALSVDAILTAQKGPSTLNSLSYDLMISTSTAEQILQATKKENVQKKASGQILIYNSYSSLPQRLIKNTRFESAKGLIYRIDTSVTVPGMTIGSNKEKTPGSVVATLYADSPGQDYNMRLADLSGDFTIPGFKGTPRYTGFFGRLKGDITGGFSGLAPVVPADVLSSTQKSLEADLRSDTWTKALAQVSNSSVLYPNLFFVTFEILPYVDAGNGNVKLTEQATSYAIVLNQRDVSRSIATQKIAGFDGAPVAIKDLEKMDVELANKNDQEPWNKPSFSFSIKGNGTLTWLFDDLKLKDDLKGISKKDLPTVLLRYPAIEKTEVVIRPFWKSSFPGNEKDIKIVKTLDD